MMGLKMKWGEREREREVLKSQQKGIGRLSVAWLVHSSHTQVFCLVGKQCVLLSSLSICLLSWAASETLSHVSSSLSSLLGFLNSFHHIYPFSFDSVSSQVIIWIRWDSCGDNVGGQKEERWTKRERHKCVVVGFEVISSPDHFPVGVSSDVHKDSLCLKLNLYQIIKPWRVFHSEGICVECFKGKINRTASQNQLTQRGN